MTNKLFTEGALNLPDGALFQLVYIARRREWGGSLSLRPDGDLSKAADVYADQAPTVGELIVKLEGLYLKYSREEEATSN